MKQELFEELRDRLCVREELPIIHSPDTHIWRARPHIEKCTDCPRMVSDRIVRFERKWDTKNRPYWVKSCRTCREKTEAKSLKTLTFSQKT